MRVDHPREVEPVRAHGPVVVREPDAQDGMVAHQLQGLRPQMEAPVQGVALHRVQLEGDPVTDGWKHRHGDRGRDRGRHQPACLPVAGGEHQDHHRQRQVPAAREAEDGGGQGDGQEGGADQAVPPVLGVEQQAGGGGDHWHQEQGHGVGRLVDRHRRRGGQVQRVLPDRLDDQDQVGHGDDDPRRPQPAEQQHRAPQRPDRAGHDQEEGDRLQEVGAVESQRTAAVGGHQHRERAGNEEEQDRDRVRAAQPDPLPLAHGLDSKDRERGQDRDLQQLCRIESDVPAHHVGGSESAGDGGQQDAVAVGSGSGRRG